MSRSTYRHPLAVTSVRASVFLPANRTTVPERGAAALVEVIARLHVAPETLRVEVHGHADRAERDPQTASQRRADAVVAYLIEHGVAGARLHVQAHGAQSPASPDVTPEAQPLNRRVEARSIDAPPAPTPAPFVAPAGCPVEPCAVTRRHSPG